MKIVHEIHHRCSGTSSGKGLAGSDGKNRSWHVNLLLCEEGDRSDSESIWIEGNGEMVLAALRTAVRLVEASRRHLIELGELTIVGATGV